jgi:hypothetical protein
MERQYVSITSINWLMLFREVVAVYSENHTKPRICSVDREHELLNVKAGGAYSMHCSLKN